MIANYVTLEKQCNGPMKGKSNTRDVSVIKMATMHCLDTSLDLGDRIKYCLGASGNFGV